MEHLKGFGGSQPFLNVIDNQHVERVVEVDKIVSCILTYRFSKLSLELLGRDIIHMLVRVSSLKPQSDCVYQMAFATTRRPVDKVGIGSVFARILGNGESCLTCNFVAIALNKVLEVLLGSEFKISYIKVKNFTLNVNI